jgi:hypothetical protein
VYIYICIKVIRQLYVYVIMSLYVTMSNIIICSIIIMMCFFDIITIIIIVAYSCYMCSVYCHNYFLLLSLSMVVIVICTPFVFILAAGATPGVVQWRDFPSPGTAG